jgi:isopentenyl diphosphate isomerase/L-lactate dehydrogenase-like FMN-dependent dehydrogenase
MIVLMDSGVRRGSDVVKALSLGAKTVLVGRPTLYGTGAGGAAGATRAIDIFREEIDRMMAHMGCRSVAELDRSRVHLPQGVLNAPSRWTGALPAAAFDQFADHLADQAVEHPEVG